MARLDDDQAEALFLTHWTATKDLRACLRLVRDAERFGVARALARLGIEQRRQRRPDRINALAARSGVLERAQELLRDFAATRDVPYEALVGREIKAAIIPVRKEAMWLLHDQLALSASMIGAIVGQRNHVVASKAVRAIAAIVAGDQLYGERLRAMVRQERRRAA